MFNKSYSLSLSLSLSLSSKDRRVVVIIIHQFTISPVVSWNDKHILKYTEE